MGGPDPFLVWCSSPLQRNQSHVLIDLLIGGIAAIIMRNRRFMIPRVSVVASLFLTFFPAYILSADVTLTNVEFYSSHKWVERKPEVYFKCTGENQTFLPDVKKANVLYSFNGEESWQPLTELQTKKCKRCGVYEDHLMSHHIFDEWELCSSDFSGSDGHHTQFKEKVLNATFLCEDCLMLQSDSPRTEASKDAGGKAFRIIPFLVTVGVVLVVIVVLVLVFNCWQKRKRQRQQARFMKLFEDDDEIEDELGLREII